LLLQKLFFLFVLQGCYVLKIAFFSVVHTPVMKLERESLFEDHCKLACAASQLHHHTNPSHGMLHKNAIQQ
jgi:hypothetical protein